MDERPTRKTSWAVSVASSRTEVSQLDPCRTAIGDYAVRAGFNRGDLLGP